MLYFADSDETSGEPVDMDKLNKVVDDTDIDEDADNEPESDLEDDDDVEDVEGEELDEV